MTSTPTFRQSLKVFPKSFWILAGATFVTKFGVFVLPFLTLFIVRKGFSEEQAGIAVGMYSIGSFGAAMIGGWMADRIGRNVSMAIASLGGAACMLGFSQVEALPLLIVLSLLTGFVSESGNPAGNALVQDMIEPEHRVNAYAVIRFSLNLGWCLGPAVAGWLAEHAFIWLFVGDAVTSAFFGVIALAYLPKGNPVQKQHAGWGVALHHIAKNPAFLSLAAAQIFLAFTFRQITTGFPLHLTREGHALHFYGWVQACNGIMICTLELGLLALSRHFQPRRVIGIGYLIVGASYCLFLASGASSTFLAVMAIFTLGEMLAFSRQQAYFSTLAHEQMRGRYSGFMGLAWCIGSSSGAIFGLRLYGWHPNALWLACLLCGLLAAACVNIGQSSKTAQEPQE